MKNELIMEVLIKKLNIKKDIVEKAMKIIQDNDVLALDDIFLSNIIASNMEIAPKDAVNIAMTYNKIKNKTEDELKKELESNEKIKKINIPLLIGIFILVVVIILSIILFLQ